MKSKDLSSDDSESISSDELASGGDDTKNGPKNNPLSSFGLPTKKNSPTVLAFTNTNGFTSAT